MNSENTWDEGETLKTSEQQSVTTGSTRLGLGRGKPRNDTNDEEPPLTTATKWNGGGNNGAADGFKRSNSYNNDENNNSNNGGFGSRSGGGFGARGERGGFGGNSGGFQSNNASGSRACYNCNQSGHMSRDCPEPRKDNRNGAGSGGRGGFNSGGSRGGFNSDGGRGGFNSDGGRGGFNSGGGRGGFNSDGGRGGFNSGGGRGGFNSDGGRGGFNSRGSRGGFDSGGGFNSSSGDRNANFGSGANGGNSVSVTARNTRNQNDDDQYGNGERRTGDWRGGPSNGNDREDSNGQLTFYNSGSRGGFRGGRGGGSDRGGFHSGADRENRDHGNNGGGGGWQNRTGNQSRDPHEGEGEGGAQPKERYIPPPAPTTEEDIFGAAVSKGENFDKYHRTHVECSPPGKVKPIELYEDGNLPTQILSNIRRASYEEPTPIQRYTIPCIRQQNDIVACAQTGSGKTAAFLLPIISNLLEYHADELAAKDQPPAPLCLIVSPTRELALQTEREARKFAYQTEVVPCSVIGGHDMFTVSDRLREGCHILSATTGRLKDMVEKGRISLKKVKYFVLDEADRMLDIGFEPDIRKLEELGLPSKDERFTSMFSATFPDQVQQLAKHFLRDNYIFLAVGTPGGANEDITQTIEEVPQANKKDRLLHLLEQNLKSERCLIFVETKRSADYLGTLLSQKKLISTTMHGDRLQSQRYEAVQQFRSGQCPILVATSVAARGLDFPLIGYVINYDLPDTTDFYIHRIGRTGRAGHLGKSISFFDPDRDSDRRIAPQLIDKLKEAGQKPPEFLEKYANDADTGSTRGGGGGGGGGGGFRSQNTDMRSGANGFGSRNRQTAGQSGGSASAGGASVQEEPWD